MQPPHLLIVAGSPDEFGVGALINNTPFVKDEDMIGPLHRGDAMRDDEQRLHECFAVGVRTQQLVDFAEQETLGFVIHSGKHVVKDEQIAGFGYRTGEADALLLPSGEHDALLADQRFGLLGETLHLLLQRGGVEHADECFL